MPKMTVEEMKEMMPERPAELDRLNAFAGSWEIEGTTKMAGVEEELKTTGYNEVTWQGDGWFLVNTWKFTMAGFDEMTGIETWMYDSHAKRYRSSWVDSTGSFGVGVNRYNKKTNTWHVKSTTYGPWGKGTGKGKVWFTDDDTNHWEWTEYAMGGLMKTFEMKGTGRRVK